MNKRFRKTKFKTLTYNGETHILSYWSKVFGINTLVLIKRVNAGWSPDECFKPVRPKRMGGEWIKEKLQRKINNLHKKKRIVAEKEVLKKVSLSQADIKAAHKKSVDKAVLKVLEMRMRRSDNVERHVTHQESIHYAISNVLQMRRSRAERLRYSRGIAA